jgi:hypothetical protein
MNYLGAQRIKAREGELDKVFVLHYYAVPWYSVYKR